MCFGLSNYASSQSELWATTNNGGSILGGTIFKLDTAGNNYSLIYDWDNLSNGKRPHCGLMQANNGKLYGVTFQDGSLFGGVLYEYDYISNIYTKKHDFTDATGSFPEGQLIQASNGKLYGLAGFGGSFNSGVLYEYDLTTDTYTNLVDFDGPIYGGGPHGRLVEAPNGKLYGLNSHGGTGGYGTLFEFDITSSTLSTKIDLDSINSGYHPYGGLTLASNGKMYALSNFGGTLNKGILYEYDYTTNSITKHVDFLGSNGASPYNDLYQASNGKLYGLTYEGGSFNKGTLFEFDIATGMLTTKFHFDGGINGSYPKGALMESSNGKLYGFNSFGGTFNKGVVFEYDLITESIITKVDFDGINGVYNSQNYFIEICAKPTINITSSSIDTLCDNELLTLTASGTGSSYTWDNSVINSTSFSPTMGPTTHTVSSTNTCGTSSLSISHFVKPAHLSHVYDSICSHINYIFPDGSSETNITSSLTDTSFFTAINTCDSIIIVHLFVYPAYNVNTIISLCSAQSYTFPDGFTQNFITSNTSHISNLQTTLFCDSIITTFIEISPTYFIEDSLTICSGTSHTFHDGHVENNITTDIIHTSSLNSMSGCDSTIKTTVRVNSTYNISENIQVCSGESFIFPDGFVINNITSPTSHTSHVFTLFGCDSIVNTNITVNPIFMVIENINLCEGYDYTFPDSILATNIQNDMTHVSNLSSTTACDTSVTTNIFIVPHYTYSIYDTICFGDSYTFPDGLSLDNIISDTTHVSNLLSINGCDSIITNLINVHSIDTSVIVIGSNQLMANTLSATYQWLDCTFNTPVFGAMSQTFIPTISGDYALIVSDNYCIDSSSCFQMITVGLDESLIYKILNTYPNPVKNEVTINFIDAISNADIIIYSLNGQILKTYTNVSGSSIQLNLSNFESGTYIININTIEDTNFIRVVKN